MASIAVWIQPLTLLMSSLAAIFAWMSKLWWSKEFAAAKDEIIRAKEARIQNLEAELARADSIPARIKRSYEETVDQYEKVHDRLRVDLAAAIERLDEKDSEIRELLKKNTSLSESERQVLESRNNLQRQIGAIQFQAEQMKPLSDVPSPAEERGGPTDHLGMALQAVVGLGGSIGWWGGQIVKVVTGQGD